MYIAFSLKLKSPNNTLHSFHGLLLSLPLSENIIWVHKCIKYVQKSRATPWPSVLGLPLAHPWPYTERSQVLGHWCPVLGGVPRVPLVHLPVGFMLVSQASCHHLQL